MSYSLYGEGKRGTGFKLKKEHKVSLRGVYNKDGVF